MTAQAPPPDMARGTGTFLLPGCVSELLMWRRWEQSAAGSPGMGHLHPFLAELSRVGGCVAALQLPAAPERDVLPASQPSQQG